MASIFEELMRGQVEKTPSRKKKATKTESKKTISAKKIKIESKKIFEDTDDMNELDAQFSVDPEESNEDEVVLVIDPELKAEDEVPEDAAQDMIGDSVYKCPVCGANYVCDCDTTTEGVEVDEDGVPTECPICGDDSDQILIGEITPSEDAGEETTMDPQEVDEVDETEEEVEEEIPEEEVPATESKKVSRSRSRKEGLDACPICGTDPCSCDVECIEEEDVPVDDVPALTLDTDNVEDDTPAVEITDSEVDLYFDDARLEQLMTKIMRENYKGTPSFKATKVSTRNGKLRIEYVVRNNKKATKGVLVGEGFNKKSRVTTVKFRDKGAFTESFSKTPSFMVECVKISNRVIPTSISYNYRVRVNESLYSVSGTVASRNKKSR